MPRRSHDSLMELSFDICESIKTNVHLQEPEDRVAGLLGAAIMLHHATALPSTPSFAKLLFAAIKLRSDLQGEWELRSGASKGRA